ncbi:oxidoreductase [Vibrio hepatarius]|mgnify:CR=1 FL=1|uniref:oxidoreductase n=1 Tax=Vibrio hepatarius TaxID=171383 RepID=UPI00142DB91F|nr:oxidoreductase [Vibrio hepatarius]NIY83747.1 oxidoreductase [Vibrio hepatarius]NVJ55014.1 oxidoreductase [Vibrionaceae bacterium]
MLKNFVRSAVVAVFSVMTLVSYASENILTLESQGEENQFTLEQLLPYVDKEVITSTPWTNGDTTFVGISAKEILHLLGVENADLKVTALNNYWSRIPYRDIEKYNPVFAIKKNGQTMSVRDKGPVWLIYPLSEFNEQNNEILHSRMVWQVNRIEIIQ